MEALNPNEITAKAEDIWHKKANSKFNHTFLSWILAWMYIALWAVFSITSIAWLAPSVPFGIIKVISWLAFSLWLILVMVAGADLFTGNALLVIALFKKRISTYKLIKNLSIVYVSNFIWAMIIVWLTYWWWWHLWWDSIIAKTLYGMWIHKLEYSFGQAFFLGVLCNILVCLGVWLAYSGKSVTDKVIGIIFPITAFVAAWFEHSVANMFYLPFAYILKKIGFTMMNVDTSVLTMGNILLKNLLPVTLGNIVWWAVFVGIIYLYLYGRNEN